MEEKKDLFQVDIQSLDNLDDYSKEEILIFLKYLDRRCESLEEEIDYQYECSLGWDI